MANTLLNAEQIAAGLRSLPGWEQRGGSIVRDFETRDFRAALAFVNAVGEAAEAADHHPDILIHGWNKVRLTLSTHSAGGLTQNDLDLAVRISGLLP